jgi:hypothetical protein
MWSLAVDADGARPRPRRSRRRARSERELILLSAAIALRRERERDRGRALCESVDWDVLAGQLGMRRLLGTLGPRIVELADGEASERFTTAVDTAIRRGRRQSTLLEAVSGRIGDALACEGIRSSPLKGPTLSRAIYGDAGRRLSSDIDLLVPAGQLNDAVKVARGLGFEAPHDHVRADGLPLLHFALAHEQGMLPAVELHWRIHWYERDFARQRLLAPQQAPADWRPDAADELAALLLFYARDGFLDLRLAADLGAWWDTRGGELEYAALASALAPYPALTVAVAAAGRVAERMLGIPVPELLARLARPGARGRIAARLADPHPRRGRAQLYADMGLIDVLLMPRGDLRAFFDRQLLPPREVLAELDRRAPKRRRRTRLPRALGVLGRYAIALTRLLGRAERPREPRGASAVLASSRRARGFLRAGTEVSALPDVCGAQPHPSTRGSSE